MTLYHQVVVAVDPFIDSEDILTKAKKILAPKGNIDLIYVREEVAVAFMGAPLAPPMVDLPGAHESKIETEKTLQKLAKKHAIPEKNAHVLGGSVSREIRDYAKKKKADCIVIGSHGRHGVALLLGSTASSVIHGTPCDILVVKIQS